MSGGTKINYYMIFGVKPDADQSEIKSRYKKLAMQFHPDMATGDEEYFKLVTQAYAILSDPYKRAVYNIDLFSGSLSHIENTKSLCLVCNGNGSYVSKVKYGRYKVDSKIVCTTCRGAGIIISENPIGE